MPTNKRESLIFTVLMCGFMVFVMSVYNVSLHMGFSWESVKEAWLGFPVAYIFAMMCDWFVVSKLAKAFAFKIVDKDSPVIKKVLAISGSMVCMMVIIMSLYGAVEVVGLSSATFFVWMKNIPRNFIMALPLQMLVAGPVVRFVFRKAFPEGCIAA